VTYKVLIVDDESLARQRLIKMFDDIDGFEIVGEAANGAIALEQLQALKPDVVLLDIRMPGIDGLQVAKTIEEQGLASKVIFTTAYDEYALDAFDVQAQGYLLKPVNKEKLVKALRLLPPAEKLAHSRTHLSASSRGNIELIPLESVRILQAEHKYVTVYHTGGESILDESLKALETQFPDLFQRVHRNALVSVDHVLSMHKNSDGQYALKIADMEIRPVVSRRLVSDVRNWMKQL
jgi:two-component system response regulator AlgR